VHDLRVVGQGGTVVYQNTVVIANASQPLTIHIPTPPPNASRSASNSISVRELSHKIPPAALKAYTRGATAAAKQDNVHAAEAFREAIAIDPELVDAYNALGAAEVALGDLPHAAEDFQKAIDLVPDHQLALPNLSIVLAKMGRAHEAVETSRRALKAVPGSCQVQYVLAVSLLMDNGDPEEALENLERAAAEVPKARLLAANVLWQLGRRDEAIRQVQQYLRDSPSDDSGRPKAEALLLQLQQ